MIRPTIRSLAVATLLMPMTIAGAGPSGRVPERPLDPLGLMPGAAEMIVQTSASRFAAEKDLLKFTDAASLRVRGAAQQIVDAKSRIEAGQTESRNLSAMLEPAGREMDAHFELLRKRGYTLGRSAAGTPEGAKFAAQVLEQIKKDAERRTRMMAESEAALLAGDPDKAFAIINPHGVELTGQTCLFATTTVNPLIGNFWGQLEKVRTAYRAQLRRQAQANLADRLTQENDRLAAVPASVQAIVGEPATDPAAVGPRLDRLAEAYAAAAVSMVRRETLTMLAGSATANASMTEADLADLFADGFAAILDRSLVAAKATGGVPAMHQTALDRYVTMRRLVGDDASLDACEAAIGRVASADATLSAQTAAYESATREILRWRKRQTAARVAQRKSMGTSAADMLASNRPTTTTIRPAILGAVAVAAMTASPAIGGPAPWQASETGSRVAGADVHLFDASPLGSPTSGRQITRMQTNEDGTAFYAMVLAGPAASQATEALAADLLAPGELKPITPEAAAALADARQGHAACVGGVVEDATLEPLSSRMANLPPAAAQLIPLDQTQTATSAIWSAAKGDPIGRALYRLDMKSTWMATDYMFAE